MDLSLRYYQEDALESIYAIRDSGGDRALCAMATGLGKTVIAEEVARTSKKPVVIFEHRGRLMKQMLKTIYLWNPNADVGLVGFGKRQWGHEITIMGVQTVTASKSSMNKLAQMRPKTVIADECFPAGTLVDGKPIETIKEGDLVTSFDECTKQFCLKKVVHTFRRKSEKLVRVHFTDGKVVHCTPNHPFFTRDGWVLAENLTWKTQVLHASLGWVPVEVVALLSYNDDVYNFEVEGTHTYTANGFVVHNCHHYQFNEWYQALVTAKPEFLLGLTATYKLGTPENIADARRVFGDICYQKTLPQGILEEQLADIRYHKVITGQVLRPIRKAGGEYVEGDLGEVLNISPRNEDIVRCMLETGAQNACCLAFCSTIEHSETLAALARSMGINAVSLTQKDNDEEDAILDALARGEINVLFSCQKLGEGFDLDLVQKIYLCSKTMSQAKYLQWVGRLTRRIKGFKEIGDVYDFFDNGSHSLEQIGLEDILGIPLAPSKSVKKALQEKLDQDGEVSDYRGMNSDENSLVLPYAYTDLRYQQKELFHRCDWERIEGGAFVTTVKLTRFLLYPAPGGRYDVIMSFKRNQFSPRTRSTLIHGIDLGYAKSIAEEQARRIAQNLEKLVDPSEKWNNDPITDEQIRQLSTLHIYIPPGCTKQQASFLMNKRFAKIKAQREAKKGA